MSPHVQGRNVRRLCIAGMKCDHRFNIAGINFNRHRLHYEIHRKNKSKLVLLLQQETLETLEWARLDPNPVPNGRKWMRLSCNSTELRPQYLYFLFGNCSGLRAYTHQRCYVWGCQNPEPV